MSNSVENLTILEKLYSETAKISWLELQRFFAQGVVMNIDPSLDLVETAVLFANDESDKLQSLIESQKVSPPTNSQARNWFEQESILWSVVVAPFVLVQDRNSDR